MRKFKFIDLFSGIGGFHQAMENLGGECVFASEIDSFCNVLYEKNYNMSSDINIRDKRAEDIPYHDVLCAGFPCQAFSKAGKQAGMEDKTRGTLFFEIVRILKYHHTPYIILENVRNLVSHDHGNTWAIIQESLRELGYRTTSEPLILSPHHFGIPQNRERVIILGKYDPENVDTPLAIKFEGLMDKKDNSIYDVLEEGPVDESYYISEYEEMVLQAWDEFYQGINLKVIGFPIWADYFKYDGSLDVFPAWKAEFIRKNIKLYKDNKQFIDQWFEKYNDLKEFAPTHHKMEWQCGERIKSVWEGVIQFRPSGVRVKTPDCFQALVAMVQIPVIGRYKRKLTVEEAARLQSFPIDDSENPFITDASRQQAYKQFGNAVNVKVIEEVAKKLFEEGENEKKVLTLNRVHQFLRKSNTYYLATVDGNKPKVRPFGTVNIFENRLYIQTGRSKAVSHQLEENPWCEICAFMDGAWLRVTGKLVDDDRVEAKKSMLDEYPHLRTMYNEQDGNTQVLYLCDAVVTFSSFGAESEIYEF